MTSTGADSGGHREAWKGTTPVAPGYRGRTDRFNPSVRLSDSWRGADARRRGLVLTWFEQQVWPAGP